MILEISSPLECRAEGRRLIGPAIRYGDISTSHRERFEPGAFTLDESTRWLNYRHEQDRVLAFTHGGGLEFQDSPEELHVIATLPRIPLADHALAEFRTRQLRGFSVEFRAIEDATENGLRVIRRAELVGVGLVEDPSYSASKAELRARSGRTLRAAIPEGVPLACACSGAGCKFAEFAQGAIDEMLDEAFANVEARLGNETIATFENYQSPLASVKRRTLRRSGKDGIEIDLPASPAGDAVISAHEDAGVIMRPFLDVAESQSVIEGETAIYSRARVRAFILSSTDQRAGWPDPIIVPTPEHLIRSKIRRFWI